MYFQINSNFEWYGTIENSKQKLVTNVVAFRRAMAPESKSTFDPDWEILANIPDYFSHCGCFFSW